MRTRTLLFAALTAAAVALLPAGAAVAAEPAGHAVAMVAPASPASPSSLLSATAWETTGALDRDGSAVPLTDPAVAGSVGWAYYRADGMFAIYNLNDTPRLNGDWSLAEAGGQLERTLVARNADGSVRFTRVVAVLALTDTVFTYRLVPNADDPSVFYDIVHTPTAHPEPILEEVGAGGEVPEPGTVETAPAPDSLATPAKAAELAETGSESVAGAVLAALLAVAGGLALAGRRVLRRTGA